MIRRKNIRGAAICFIIAILGSWLMHEKVYPQAAYIENCEFECEICGTEWSTFDSRGNYIYDNGSFYSGTRIGTPNCQSAKLLGMTVCDFCFSNYQIEADELIAKFKCKVLLANKSIREKRAVIKKQAAIEAKERAIKKDENELARMKGEKVPHPEVELLLNNWILQNTATDSLSFKVRTK
jgi:hypothetical protein